MNYAYIRPINISLYNIHDQVIDMLMIKLGHRSMMDVYWHVKDSIYDPWSI